MFELDPRFARHGIKFLIFGGLLVFQGIRVFAQSRIDQSVPESKVSSLAAGLCRLRGVSSNIESVIAPFSQQAANLFMITVSAWRIGGWVPKFIEGYWEEWELVDQRGDMIAIEPDNLELLAANSKTRYLFPWSDKTLCKELEELGVSPYIPGTRIPRLLKIEEQTIQEGDEIELVGVAQPGEDGLEIVDTPETLCRVRNISKPPKPLRAYFWSCIGFLLLGLGVFTLVGVGAGAETTKHLWIIAGATVFTFILFILALRGWSHK